MEISREADTLRALYQNWTDQMVENPDLTIANLRSMFLTSEGEYALPSGLSSPS